MLAAPSTRRGPGPPTGWLAQGRGRSPGHCARRPRAEPASRPTRILPMCGIVGYVGGPAAGTKPLEVVLEGLRRLEYRGYDSAGIALVGEQVDGVATSKKAGKLANLVAEL